MFKSLGGGGLAIALVIASALLVPLFAASNLQYSSAQAQDTPYNNIPSSSSESFTLSSDLLESLTQQFASMGIESEPVGGTLRSGFESFTLDSIEQFGVGCDNLVVLFADPVAHQLLPVEVDCDGSRATVPSFGPGSYLFFDEEAAFPFHFTSPRRIVTDTEL